MVRSSLSLDTSETLRTTFSSDLFSFRNSTDTAIGTSVDADSEASSTNNLEKQICDLQIRNQKLIDLEYKKLEILNEIESCDFGFDQKRLELERALLSTSLKTELLLWEFRQKYESKKRNNFCNIGSVTVQNLKVNYLPSKKYKEYFLCSLSYGAVFFLSPIFQCDSEGTINFNINHNFMNLPVDFNIRVRIYVLKVKIKNFRQKLWKKFSCFPTTTPTENNTWRRDSMFKFWKETNISISSINESNEILLELVNSKLCKLVFDVIGKIDVSSFSFSGWMDVSKNGLFWNQKWCELRGTTLKCFNYPYDTCYNIIDLNLCTSVKVAGAYELSRNKVIILEMNHESNYPFCFYLTTDSNNEFSKWKILEKLVPTLRLWKNYESLAN